AVRKLKRRERARARPALLHEREAGRINRPIEIVAGHALAARRALARRDLVVVQPQCGLRVNDITNGAIETGGLRSRKSESRHRNSETNNTAHEFLLNLRRPSDP